MKLIFISFLFLTSCAHSIHQVYTSDFNLSQNPAETKAVKIEMGKMIKVQTEQFVVLGFTTQTDYINQAYNSLQSQCPGPITGITTQLSSSLGFLSWTNKALMQGLCLF